MSENWKVQASFKFGQAQNGLLNVRADSPAELKTTLDSLASLDVLGDITTTTETIHALDNASSLAAPTPAPAPAAPPNAVPAAAPVTTPPSAAPAAGDGVVPPQCLHGQKGLLTKPSKNKPGEFWTAWACPADQHDPTKCALDFNVPAHLKR